jgi:hypothetical protein
VRNKWGWQIKKSKSLHITCIRNSFLGSECYSSWEEANLGELTASLNQELYLKPCQEQQLREIAYPAVGGAEIGQCY